MVVVDQHRCVNFAVVGIDKIFQNIIVFTVTDIDTFLVFLCSSTIIVFVVVVIVFLIYFFLFVMTASSFASVFVVIFVFELVVVVVVVFNLYC